MRTLFLDFDGVLHSTAHGSVLFSQRTMLERVLENADCQIVISSSWRFHAELSQLREYFSKDLQTKVVGVTGEPYIGAYARFHEINAYVSGNDITDWRALDDSYWEFPKDCRNLIRCNPNTGLSLTEVNLVKSWLVV